MSENCSENCTHDCGSCGAEGCGERTQESLIEKPHAKSHVKKVIGIVSGKGGVGKSSISALSAVTAAREGFNTAIIDADITGPSIPRMFGVEQQVYADEEGGIIPALSKSGIKMISTNLVLENPDDPVVWRGPIIAGAVRQFWTDVVWGDVDFMFVDMPPGTGDVPLTVFQSLPVDGIIVVTSPQDLVSMIVEKALKMAEMMNVPVLGIVENMSYVTCPGCGERINVFGESHVDEIAKEHELEVLAQLPIDPEFAQVCDKGQVEFYNSEAIDGLAKLFVKIAEEK